MNSDPSVSGAKRAAEPALLAARRNSPVFNPCPFWLFERTDDFIDGYRSVAFVYAKDKKDGAAAWYQVVSPVPAPLGIDFYAKRLFSIPVPSAPVEGEDEGEVTHEGEAEGEGEGESAAGATPLRPFAPIKGQSLRPEDTLPELAETRYVILYQPIADDYITKLEEAVLFFTRQGFESLVQQTEDGGPGLTPGCLHVLARREFPTPDAITRIFDLYDMLDQDGRNYLLSEEDRAKLEQRYAALVSQYADPRPLNGQINLLGFHVKPLIDDWSVVRLVVHVKEPPKTDLRVWMRARPREEDRNLLFETQREQPALVWDFSPEPPSTAWKQNEALVLTRPVMAHPLTYELEIALYGPDKESAPRDKYTTEWVRFGANE